MNKRERDYEQTKQELRNALARLIANKPECPELKNKFKQGKVLKINNANVEKEAGKANQALRSHADVREEIERAASEREFGKTAKAGSVKDDPIFIRTKSQLERSIAIRKKLEAEKAALREEVERKDMLVNKHIAHMDEMLAALWGAIPPDDIEARMTAAKKLVNVIEVKFK